MFPRNMSCEILMQTHQYDYYICIYFRSGTYSLTDEDGGCCGKQHGR